MTTTKPKRKRTDQKPVLRRERELNLNVRVTEEERAKVHALAADRDLPVSALLRHFIRESYAARFGNASPMSKDSAA